MAPKQLFWYTDWMLQIEIDIPRPWSMLFWSTAVVGAVVYFSTGDITVTKAEVNSNEGGSGKVQAVVVQQAENDAKSMRVRQIVLAKRESILRSELEDLDAERSNDPAMTQQLTEARIRLADLLLDKRAAESELAQSFQQIWEAQGYASQLSKHADGDLVGDERFVWPVTPNMGLSARFDDAAYQARFGMPHQAIDIPTPQGTPVMAAADGVVMKVSDNGLGFNSIIIKHANGMATLYGHVTKFLVAQGDNVSAGEAIALSGGTPGTPGAGHMTTGAHLHFQMLKDGVPVDPLTFLSSQAE